MAAIEIRNLTLTPKGVNTPVLSDVSFAIPKGQIVLLVGYTGSGKSTLLGAIAGTLEGFEVSGEIILEGERSPGGVSSKVGYLSQNPEVQVFKREAQEEFLFGLENVGIERSAAYARSAELFSHLEISLDAPTRTLSAGQLSQLMCASIIALERPILLLDEPLANLDLPAVRALLKQLRALSERGITILMAEHRLGLVQGLADRVLRCQDGRVVEAEEQPSTPFTIPSPPKENHSSVPLLSVENLSVSYGEKKVLNHLNLTVHKGERIVILGANGAGKTTLLNRLAGLVRIRRKDGRLKAFDLPRPGSRAWFKRVGVVMHDPVHQFFCWTVRAELEAGAKDSKIVEELLESLDLKRLESHQPLALSTGEKRRLIVACALAKRPDLILLDEPTVGQDPTSLARILEALNRAAATGCALVTVTHDRQTALALSDTAYVLESGQLRPLDGPEAIEEYFDGLESSATQFTN